MSSWYSSWLPGLPALPSLNFAISSGIQARFISFILKKSLGHLLKPGQLESRQIESQIGSGYVQVNDLELNSEAINEFLVGLPIILHQGTISAVTARIPWPNPLTSNIGFSLKSLHLTFHLATPSTSIHQTNVSLADSVASVADSFIHEELSPREEATLWQSLHSDLESSVIEEGHNVPGGLDPFLSAREDEIHQMDNDPAGISIFATLIERLLARFEFDAEDIKITLVHSGNISLTVSLSEIRYRTDGRGEYAASGNSDGKAQGESRTLSVAGFTLSACDLHPPRSGSPVPAFSDIASHSSPGFPSPSQEAPHMSPRSASPSSSSSSSFDDETQFAMSQSLAFLPPRAVSPTSSVASSMYKSAISGPSDSLYIEEPLAPEAEDPEIPQCRDKEADTPTENRGEAIFEQDIFLVEEPLLSFGPSPIIVRLTTPSPVSGRSEVTISSSQKPLDTADKLQLTVTAGVVACVFYPWSVRGIIRLADCWISRTPQTRHAEKIATIPNNSTNVPGFELNADATIRGIVVLLTQSPTDQVRLGGSPLLTEYFNHPLIPPRLPHGYLRLYLEGLSTSLSTSRPKGVGLHNRPRRAVNVDQAATSLVTVTLGDLSLFSFHGSSVAEGDEAEMIVSPVLITDPQLPTQYSSAHLHPDGSSRTGIYPHLPTFDVVDWTDDKSRRNGMKLSFWRYRPKQKGGKHDRLNQHTQAEAARSPIINEGNAQSSFAPALSVHIRYSSSRQDMVGLMVEDVEIKVTPLHVFLDLGQVLKENNVLAFLDEALASDPDNQPREPNIDNSTSDDGLSDATEEQDTPPATPRARSALEREKERKRLEQLIIEDLDLNYDYRGSGAPMKRGASARDASIGRKSLRKQPRQPSISVNFPMVRLQARCPPPPGCSSRSGALVVDLHGINITNKPAPLKPPIRFASMDPSAGPAPAAPGAPEGHLLLAAGCKRIVVACSLVGAATATSVLSLGSLDTDINDVELDGNSRDPISPFSLPPLLPRITVTKSDILPPIIALSVDIPSAHVDISKSLLDALQYWADDSAQLIERTFGNVDDDGGTGKYDSRDTSLIGSRFFAKSRAGSGSGFASSPGDVGSETVVKLSVSEACVRIMLPRSADDQTSVRPFDVSVVDLDVLIELRPEGKAQTVVTLGIAEITVKDTLSSGTIQTYLSLILPHSLSSVPKPLVKLRFTSLLVPETTAKESRVKLTLCGFICNLFPDVRWVSDIGSFVKSPPGAFESVVPSERTSISVKIVDGSVRAFAPTHPGALVFYVGDLEFSTDIIGDSPEISFHALFPTLALFAIDDISTYGSEDETDVLPRGSAFWKASGYALLAEVADLDLKFWSNNVSTPRETQVSVDRIILRLHLCADSLSAVAAFASDLGSAFKPSTDDKFPKPTRGPTVVSKQAENRHGIMSSVDDLAFRRVPEVGPAPDMINDDLPTNLDYLDESFGTAAGLRELRDDDLDEFDMDDTESGRISPTSTLNSTGVTSRIGGETIKILQPEGVNIIEGYFDDLPPAASTESFRDADVRVRIRDANLTILLYDGYDWVQTRKTIEEEVKEMRRRLAKIRQLVASGQTQDSSVEETSALLFNSVYIGLEQDVDALEPGALIAAIDEELKEDMDTESQSSWQSLRPPVGGKARSRPMRVHGRRLTRSKSSRIEFCLFGTNADMDQYGPEESLVSRTFVTVKDLEILDHMKTSTWKKFLTDLRSDSQGNIRESDSNMVRIELRNVRPVPGHPSEEARLRAKILPLRLYVDQDALDFLKKFFSFKDPHASPSSPDSSDGNEAYIQMAEIFPVHLKLDYKPRRVDYRALREGRTIELMNFFHFDGAEMTLRHITLSGVTGWPRLFDMLNDLWTPDVKATQLAEVISGVAPIRSVVNVGSGVADLVLLPIAQYKKDGRIVRGIQKGATAFVKSTAIEAIKMGARLATGTQVILEQAEGVLGGQFNQTLTAETLQVPSVDEFGEPEFDLNEEEEPNDLISRYAEQPTDIKEGMQSAYKSLRKNLNSAAQTILAVPMEVYERSGNEGPVRSVIRAVPIAVLKPMIGASEAVSKTLLGLHNTLDPNVRHENEAKYKHR